MAYGAWMVWRATEPDARHGRWPWPPPWSIVAWMAVNKVWNPQYVLWVVRRRGGGLDARPLRRGPRVPLRLSTAGSSSCSAGPIAPTRSRTGVRGRGGPLPSCSCDGGVGGRASSAVWTVDRVARRSTTPSDPRHDRPGCPVDRHPIPAAALRTHRRRAPSLRWMRAHPGLVVLLAIPLVVFGLPQLFGGRSSTGQLPPELPHAGAGRARPAATGCCRCGTPTCSAGRRCSADSTPGPPTRPPG